ncbi:hypothetical protein B0A52_09121 [Exophiala mesophila]|uniref:DHHA2 domain-containing protein n=1 Tax=Exophiala mesophila TaxID=212818 RepID=A0A438MUD4_EXOME|nr:hypothetical protein B0A52_09121 [Exophiala mesophila]
MASTDSVMPSLSSYLSLIRKAAFQSPRPSASSTLILGNPSADLDSFVSAILLSYFYNCNSQSQNRQRRQQHLSPGYIPILNLPTVASSDLWRLRPEFGVAIRLALGHSTAEIDACEDHADQSKVPELEQVVTIADFKKHGDSNLIPARLFSDSDKDSSEDQQQRLMLVDHNAPSIPGLSESTIRSRFSVTGVIDHHVDEDYVSKKTEDINPRIITTGIGSCTSLVVQHLRDEGMWPSAENCNKDSKSSHNNRSEGDKEGAGQLSTEEFLEQLAKLALAPILIDTANLLATGDKCSDTDRHAVRFLESFIPAPAAHSNLSTTTNDAQGSHWDRDSFYSCISTTKTNSLNLLTTQETFDRDYKSWSETQVHSQAHDRSALQIEIGIASLVKPLSWLIAQGPAPSTVKSFVDEMRTFATAEERRLGVFVLLTRREDGGKELVLAVLDDAGRGLVHDFETKAGPELQLRAWDTKKGDWNPSVVQELRANFLDAAVWDMCDTSKSRKQVGPLVRQCVRELE